MSDSSLTVKVEAKGVGDLKKPFEELKKGAERADLSLKDYGKTVSKFRKDLSGLQGGLLSLSTSADLLPKGVGKAILSLNALSGAASALKGAGGLAATVGGSGVLGGIALGIAAIGSAAVLASPKLQETLGKAMLKVSGQAEEMEAALKRSKDRLDDIRSARALGIGTEKEEAAAAMRLSVVGPRREQQRALGVEKVSQLARAGALQQFPDTEFDIFGAQLQNQLKPGKFRENAAFLREAAAGPQPIPAEAIRQEIVAKAEQAELARQDREARERLTDVRERFKFGQQVGKASAVLFPTDPDKPDTSAAKLAELNKKVEAEQGFLKAKTRQDDFRRESEARLRSFTAQRDSIAALRGEAERNLVAGTQGLAGRKATTGEEVVDAVSQQEAAASRLRAHNEKLLETKQKINQAEIDGLKNIQQQVAEQQKLSAAAVQEEEAKLKGLKSSLGLEDKESIREQLTIARKIAGGKNLSDEDIKAVRGQEIFREALEKIGQQRTDQDKDRQELLRLLGADRKLQEAKQAQDELVKLDATIKHEIKLKVEADSAATAADIVRQVAPEIEKALASLSLNIETLLEVKTNQATQKALQQLKAAESAQN